ncbi:MAG: hypothetical protein ORN58_06875, partial [Sediminibacterium sp.]|nr:hypothetical protein [Sediminibacterium sp.]
ISKNNFLNQKGKQIQSNSTATNSDFINLLKTTDPIVQVYYYERDKSKGINGVVIIPDYCIQSVTKEFIVIKNDGSFGKIKGDVEPKENYLVISTNERSGPEWKKIILDYHAQQKEITNIRPKLSPITNIDGSICLSNPKDAKNGSVIINSSQDFALLTKSGHNSYETYNITNNLQNNVNNKYNDEKYTVMLVDNGGCLIDDNPLPFIPPPTPPTNPDDYPNKIQRFTSARFPSLDKLHYFCPWHEGQPEVNMHLLVLVTKEDLGLYPNESINIAYDGDDTYYLANLGGLWIPGNHWYYWGGFLGAEVFSDWNDFSYNSSLVNNALGTIENNLPILWEPRKTSWYRGLIVNELDARTYLIPEEFKIPVKNGHIINFSVNNIKYSTADPTWQKIDDSRIVTQGYFDIREGSYFKTIPKKFAQYPDESPSTNTAIQFTYNLTDN